MGLVFCLLVYYTPMFAQEDGQFPMSYYTLVLIIYAFHQVKLQAGSLGQIQRAEKNKAVKVPIRRHFSKTGRPKIIIQVVN